MNIAASLITWDEKPHYRNDFAKFVTAPRLWTPTTSILRFAISRTGKLPRRALIARVVVTA
jgi:hypothetical protein